MLERLVRYALHNPLLVAALAGLLVLLGARSLALLPIDAFPDTTPVQVQVNTVASALNPEEVEAQITVPLELAIGGLPGLVNVRSISKFGLSQVVATFGDGTPVLQARQLIAERIQAVELPPGLARPQLGPMATGLGEVFHYIVRSSDPRRTLADLREIQDWVVKPALRQVRGVAEINSWGGYEKQYHVVVDPDRLVKHGLTFDHLFAALEANNQNVGGGLIDRAGESIPVHGLGLATDAERIGNILVATHQGVPVHVHEVATVRIDHEIRRGAVTADGRGEAVLGLGFMLLGENSATVTRALKARLAEVQKTLPSDVVVEVLYDRTELVDQVLHTVGENLVGGAALVVAVLFAFLGNFRAGLVVAAAIPLAMLFAGNLMLQAGITASLLSLGAIDFGLIVDGSVVMVENTLRRLAETQTRLGRALTPTERQNTLTAAPVEVARPVAFGVGIILVVFLPVLALEGHEGRMFRPMALTLIFALLGSLLLALTVTPVLSTWVLPALATEREAWIVRVFRRCYSPCLDWALRHRRLTLAAAAITLAAAFGLATQLGGEFLPKLGEGAIVGTTVRLAGISVDEAVQQNQRIEQGLLAAFPDEIARIWTRLGTAEVATDPMGVELSDFFLALKPRSQWRKARTQAELTDLMRAWLDRVPGLKAAFSQPIEMRINELVAGIRGDLGLKIRGDNLDTLRHLAGQVQEILARVPGASEVSVEQLTGQALLKVQVDPQASARHGVPTRRVLDVVEAVGGRKVGVVREGQRHFPLVVRLPDAVRRDPDALARTLIPTAAGPVLTLDRLARLTETEGPATINREWGQRRITVQCNVRGRDVARFVAEARRQIASQVRLPNGYSLDWGGQFENLERANRRLLLVVPSALASIAVLLYFALKSTRLVLIVASGIPFGLIGGVLALWLRGLPFTVSAAIGFIALSGVAILNGLVLTTFFVQQLAAGLTPDSAARRVSLDRLRPVLMTALVAAVGFIPMAINVGVGGEIQRPLATVVIGGILTNTLLTLLVLPILCAIWSLPKPASARRFASWTPATSKPAAPPSMTSPP